MKTTFDTNVWRGLGPDGINQLQAHLAKDSHGVEIWETPTSLFESTCARAIEDTIADVVVYRAKETTHPRAESESKIGQSINAKALLEDLRIHQGVDTAFGLPAGPNSGLSVKLL